MVEMGRSLVRVVCYAFFETSLERITKPGNKQKDILNIEGRRSSQFMTGVIWQKNTMEVIISTLFVNF